MRDLRSVRRLLLALLLGAVPALLLAQADNGAESTLPVSSTDGGAADAGSDTPDAGTPAPDGGAPDDDEEEEDDGWNNGDWDDDLPTPENPRDLPKPPGYAPDEPQPFLSGGLLFFVQVVAALGARGMLGVVAAIPVVGLLAVLVAPAAEALAVQYAGDRLGPYRSYLVFVASASYLAFASSATLAAGLLLAGSGLGAVGGGALVALAFLFPTVGVPIQLSLVAGGPALAVGVALGLLGVAVAWLGSNVLSPVVAVAIYHVTRTPKRLGDNGTGIPRLLPSVKLPTLPFFKKDPQEQEEEDERRRSEGQTPVEWRP
ncbi:MAG: hypothetical protein AB2A00_37575 [Myxococcota bacterium]